MPLYPWEPGRWDRRPDQELPRTHVDLPEQGDAGFTIKNDVPGMEAVQLLAREAPLERDVDLPALLGQLTAQPTKNPDTLVWFAGGRVDASNLRRTRSFDVEKLEDPLVKNQWAIHQRVRSYFPFNRAAAFANRGE